VRIYRNGKPYAAYTVAQPQAFGPDAFVLIGLRYLGSMGAIGPLAGAVEEARLYDVALDEAQIAALEPNRPGDVRPLARWTFEDGTAQHRAARDLRMVKVHPFCHQVTLPLPAPKVY
jgi:hypothetical protein